MTLQALTPSWDISVGDATGFIALILIATSSLFMYLRSKLLKLTKNLGAVRGAHIVVSMLAGIFLLAHVAYLFAPPTTLAIDLGYVAVGVSVCVWLTGTAFLERLRDSLFFHGTLSTILAGLVVVHAAGSSANIPVSFAELMLGFAAVIMVANAAHHLHRALSRPQAVARKAK